MDLLDRHHSGGTNARQPRRSPAIWMTQSSRPSSPGTGALVRVHPGEPEGHRTFLHALHRSGYRGRSVAAADDPGAGRLLRRLGVDVVIRPLQLAAGPLMDTIHAPNRGRAQDQRTLARPSPSARPTGRPPGLRVALNSRGDLTGPGAHARTSSPAPAAGVRIAVVIVGTVGIS